MSKNFSSKYRVELSADSKYVDIYSNTGRLIRCFSIRIEEGHAVLSDSVMNSISIIPTKEKAIGSYPFEYDSERGLLSVGIQLEDKTMVIFESPIQDLVERLDFNHHKPSFPQVVRPNTKPTVDKFATVSELMDEVKMRRRGDDELAADAKYLDKRIANLEDALKMNESGDSKLNKKVEFISDDIEKLKHQTLKLSESLNKEEDDRIKAQNRLYDSFLAVQMQSDKNSDKINDLDNTVTRNRNHLLKVERDLHDEVKHEISKCVDFAKNINENVKDEAVFRTNADKELEGKINIQSKFIKELKAEMNDSINHVMRDFTSKYEILMKEINDLKANMNKQVVSIMEQIHKLEEKVNNSKIEN